MKKSMLPITILLSLVLSACATAPKEEVVPEPVAMPAVEQTDVVEPATAPEVVPEPQAMAQAETPKPVVKKKKRRVVKAAPKPVEVAPVVQPEPVVEPAPAPVVTPVQESPAPVMVAAPVTRVQEEGFLEKYWIWLLGIVIAVAVVLLLVRKQE